MYILRKTETYEKGNIFRQRNYKPTRIQPKKTLLENFRSSTQNIKRKKKNQTKMKQNLQNFPPLLLSLVKSPIYIGLIAYIYFHREASRNKREEKETHHRI